jgi:hypothetical protein
MLYLYIYFFFLVVSFIFIVFNIVFPFFFFLFLLSIFLFRQKLYNDLKFFMVIFLILMLGMELFFQCIFVEIYGEYFFSGGFLFIYDIYS